MAPEGSVLNRPAGKEGADLSAGKRLIERETVVKGLIVFKDQRDFKAAGWHWPFFSQNSFICANTVFSDQDVSNFKP